MPTLNPKTSRNSKENYICGMVHHYRTIKWRRMFYTRKGCPVKGEEIVIKYGKQIYTRKTLHKHTKTN
jgi:hypothetical protein